ncbi:MAG: elongation factor P, partial [Dehalococcoidales bacterium]|nr:elongation factor P [Dehalococcoidales bacterium]
LRRVPGKGARMEIEDVRKNTKLIIDGVIYNAEDVEFVKPGKGRAVYRLRLKSLRDGSVIERTYRSGDKVDEAVLTTEDGQFLYHEGDQYVFMDAKTYEQRTISEELLGMKKYFLKEGTEVTMLMMGDEMIDVNLPITVDLKVVETEVATKTATITPQMKTSVLETGYRIDTPPFIRTGDIIKVDTRTGTYVERVSAAK